MSQVEVRLFAGAAEAFGAPTAGFRSARTLADLKEQLLEAAPSGQGEGPDERLGEVLDQCSFFIDGEHHRSLETALPESCKVDVLPPFAGG